VNKPAPLPMHAAGRFNRNTLHFILNKAYYPEKPKQAHRLDANTTGVVLLTRTRHYAALVQPQFAHGAVEKVYLARVQGHPPADAFTCDAPISIGPRVAGTREVDAEEGLPARTDFRVRARDADGTAWIEARPVTGRTNQIRVHLWHLGFPICGDAMYLPNRQLGTTQTLGVDAPPLCLHSWRLSFVHPLTRKRVGFEAPLPPWGRAWLEMGGAQA
jgi:RluA family pseudouridine synthase